MNARSTRPNNSLLSSISETDFRLIAAQLEPVELPLRFTLEESNKPIKFVYFLEAGIASVVAYGSRKREIEVGLIGREGMSGINILLGSDRSPHATYMQVRGRGVRIPAKILRAAIKESHSLHRCLLQFVQALMVQTAHTALANGQARVEERLARWLLMAHDRMDDDQVPLTHEFLAMMLAVRRPGVTLALQLLERRDLIDAKRGTITIQDRGGLEKVADGLYGIPEAAYSRLYGQGGKGDAQW